MLLARRTLARALTSRRTMSSAAAAAAGSSGGAGAPPPAASAVQQQQVLPVLDRAAFKRVVTLPALRVPKARCNELMRVFRG